MGRRQRIQMRRGPVVVVGTGAHVAGSPSGRSRTRRDLEAVEHLFQLVLEPREMGRFREGAHHVELAAPAGRRGPPASSFCCRFSFTVRSSPAPRPCRPPQVVFAIDHDDIVTRKSCGSSSSSPPRTLGGLFGWFLTGAAGPSSAAVDSLLPPRRTRSGARLDCTSAKALRSAGRAAGGCPY